MILMHKVGSLTIAKQNDSCAIKSMIIKVGNIAFQWMTEVALGII